ncbi:MAG TPA: hypothetical protein VIO84_13270 [Candidatus Dormibacteraeota bacterium]
MRAAWGVALIAILVGCGGATPKPAAAAHTPSPSASPTPYLYQPPTPGSSSAPTVQPPYTPPVSASAATYARLASFNCRVPISNGQPGGGGFVGLPGGAFTSDPASNVALDWSGAPPPKQTAPGPGRPPTLGLSYDRAVGKWVPVSANLVAPDGQSYAYPDFVGGGVRYVKISDGSVTTMGASSNWNLLDVEAEGVYAQRFDSQGAAPAGLWLLAPSKDPVQVVTGGYWQWVTTGFAYGYDAPSVPQGAPHPLQRLNLRDHTTVTWYHQGEQIQWIAGFDTDGSPIAIFPPANYYTGATWETALLPRPDEKIVLLQAPQGGQTPAVHDTHGYWIVADQLYFNSVPVSAVGGQLGGGCA